MGRPSCLLLAGTAGVQTYFEHRPTLKSASETLLGNVSCYAQ